MTTPRSTASTSLNSRIDTVLAEDGDYVDHRHLLPARTRPAPIGSASRRAPACRARSACPAAPRVIALLVGVSDYGGRTSDLPNTDDDARELYNSLQRRRPAASRQPSC